jgi:hypothetical protein
MNTANAHALRILEDLTAKIESGAFCADAHASAAEHRHGVMIDADGNMFASYAPSGPLTYTISLYPIIRA